MLKRLVTAALLGIAIAATGGTALAHSAKPKHGGVVREAGDLTFEIVASAEGAVLHVEDHGKPLATAGMSGKLTVLEGKQTTEAALAPAGENRLAAKGIKLAKGARAVAVITTAQKKTLTVRFVLR